VSILVWIILGLIAGWLASTLMGGGGYGLIGDIIVGIVGALIGGFIGSALFGVAVTGLNLISVVLAVAGAIVLIAILRLVSGGARSGA
jgi:uncharacterized membrane protein YeaQ/YmgE (transglycosylase-associated protein family)